MDPLLQQTESAVLANVKDPQLQQTIQRVVQVGQQIMYAPQMRQALIKQLMAGGDITELIGGGIAKLIGILIVHQPKIPPQIIVPTAQILLCDALDFLEHAGKVQVDPAFLSQCTKALMSNLMQLLQMAHQQQMQHKQIMSQLGQPAQQAQPGQPAPPPDQPAAPTAPGGNNLIQGGPQPGPGAMGGLSPMQQQPAPSIIGRVRGG